MFESVAVLFIQKVTYLLWDSITALNSLS